MRCVLALVLLITMSFAMSSGDWSPNWGMARVAGDIVIPEKESLASGTMLVGGRVDLEGSSMGDLFIAGGEVNVKGPILGRLMAFGGLVVVTSQCSGDVTVAAGHAIVRTPDTPAISPGITAPNAIKPPSLCKLEAAGGLVEVDSFPGSVKIEGDKVILSGQFPGDVQIRARQIILSPGTTIGGVFRYRAVTLEGQEQLTCTMELLPEEDEEHKETVGQIILGKFLAFLMWSVLAYLLWLLAPRFSASVISCMRTSPWQTLGLGFIGLIGSPIAIILLMLTVIGILAGVSLALFWIVGFLLSIAIMGTWLGEWLWGLLFKGAKPYVLWSILLGMFVWQILLSIPILGFVVGLATIVMGMGAIIGSIFKVRNRKEIVA